MRHALEVLALGSALVAGCHADAAGVEPAPPAAVGARATDASAQRVPQVGSTRATEHDPVAPASTAVLVAAPEPTATPPSEVGAREAPPAGCIANVEDLPDAQFLRRDDARLLNSGLVVVSKGARRLMLFDAGRSVACYRVGLGFAPEGHKLEQGDGRTPEGWYRTSDKPWSSFEHAIAIHYPSADDARDAARDGRVGKRTRDAIISATGAGKVPPQATALGGAVLIHGGGSGFDWTLGCVALDDAELVALRERLPKGMRTDLLILP
jgi:L,D-transpeptidase catalytic domain